MVKKSLPSTFTPELATLIKEPPTEGDWLTDKTSTRKFDYRNIFLITLK
jgi:hypothetical protein